MQIAAGVPFERSARLSPRHRPGLPRRRRPAYRVLTVIPVCVLASAVIIVTGTDLAALGAVALVVSLFVTTWFALVFASASGGRTRYRALREELGKDGVALRSTAWIDSGVPFAASEAHRVREVGRPGLSTARRTSR